LATQLLFLGSTSHPRNLTPRADLYLQLLAIVVYSLDPFELTRFIIFDSKHRRKWRDFSFYG
jgi:hypothetical protein